MRNAADLVGCVSVICEMLLDAVLPCSRALKIAVFDAVRGHVRSGGRPIRTVRDAVSAMFTWPSVLIIPGCDAARGHVRVGGCA